MILPSLIWFRVGGLVAHEIELAAEEIAHGRPRAAIRDAGHADAKLLHQHQRAEVRGGTDTGMPIGDLVFFCPNPVQQLTGGFRRQRGLRHECHGHIGDAADTVEVLENVVLQVVVQRGCSCLSDVPHGNGVAVGCGLGDARHPDRAAGAADVFDNDRLSQVPPMDRQEAGPCR